MAFDPSCIDVEDFLEALEIRNVTKATEHELRFSCPYPNHVSGDEKPSAYMNIHTTAFFCHGCKERGDAITFAADILGITPIESSRLLRQKYQPGGINPAERGVVNEVRKILAPDPEPTRNVPLDEDVLTPMQVEWEEAYYHFCEGNGFPATDYLFKRGFNPISLGDWEVVYDAVTDRPAVTVRDEHGNLVGFKGRAWGAHQKPKYLVLGDKPDKPERYGFPCYQPSLVIFGANRVEPGSEIVVCEGELNAIATNDKTGLPAVAINGSYFTQAQAKILRRIATKITCFLDTDKAGEAAVWGWHDSKGNFHPGMVAELSQYMPVHITPPHAGDAVTMSKEEIKACLADSKSALLHRLL